MATSGGWPELGRKIRARRESRSLSGRAAELAGGPSEPTWRRVEAGQPVGATSLYRICATLGLEEDEARSWFALSGMDFDAAGYERPLALDQLIESLKAVKREIDSALAAALAIESESRSQR